MAKQAADDAHDSERGAGGVSVRVSSRLAGRLQCGDRGQFIDSNRDDPLDVADFRDAEQSRQRHPQHAGRRGPHLGQLVWRHLQGSAEFLRPIRGRARELPADVSGDHPHARPEAGVSRRSNRVHRRRRTGPAFRVEHRRPHRVAGRHSDLWHAGLRLHDPRHLHGRRQRGRQPVDDVQLEVRRRTVD